MRPRKAIARIHPRLAVVAHDMFMVWLAWSAVSALRWSMETDAAPVSLFGAEVWFVLAAQGLVFWWTGLYRGLWRFASMPDMWNILRACLVGAFAVAITLFLFITAPVSAHLLAKVALGKLALKRGGGADKSTNH